MLRYRSVPRMARSYVIETTSRCNLRCRMCPRLDMQRPMQDMPTELFQRVIDQIAEADARREVDLVALHGFGEPLLHQRLLEMIEYAGQRLPKVRAHGPLRHSMKGLNVSTNAVLLDEQKAEALLDSRLTWIAVSVDGNTADTYEAMRVGARFEQVVENVQRLLDLNRRKPRALPTIAVQVIASRTATPEFEACMARWREEAGAAENVLVELKPYTDWAGQVEAEELHVPDCRGDFLYVNCGHPYHTQIIDADGRIALCCYDVRAAQGLGNAQEQGLEELWQGGKLNEIRGTLGRGKAAELPLCRNCTMPRKYPLDYLRRRKKGCQ